jgi:succinyl-CoA synthetase alpha subunit
MEAADAGIKVIIAITEEFQLLKYDPSKRLCEKKCTINRSKLSWNYTPGEAKSEYYAWFCFSKKGTVGIVSKSGTLTYKQLIKL